MLQITLKETDIKEIIRLSGDNPEIIELLELKVQRANKNVRKAIRRRTNKLAHKDAAKVKAAEGFRKDLIKNATQAEIVFKALLKSLDIKYSFQEIIYNPDTFYIVDFFLPKENIIIEIDGYHHTSKEQKKLDARRTKVLKESGIKKVYRFKNSDVLKNHGTCISKIKQLIQS